MLLVTITDYEDGDDLGDDWDGNEFNDDDNYNYL